MIALGIRKDAGFSLVELVVGIAMSAILAVVLGMLLYLNFRVWQNNTASVTLQQDAILVTNTISKVVRTGKVSTVSVSGTGTSSVLNVGAAQFYLTSATPPYYTLSYRTASGNVIPLAVNEVTSAVSVFANDATTFSVTVNMTLNNRGQVLVLNFTTGYRN